jgi:hypothetical protein
MPNILINAVEKYYIKHISEKKHEGSAESIRATFEVIFLYGTK